MSAGQSALAPETEPLTEADYKSLARRWIDKPLADSAGIQRVDSHTGASLVGRRENGSGRYDGLIIPYFLPGESHAREYRLRRDHPDIENQNGKLREAKKYLSPPGRGNLVYFPPGATQQLLADPKLTVIVTEGEFKTLALWRLAHHGSAPPRFLPVGLGGVWNWRGIVGKTTGPDGERRDVKGTIADLDRIKWEGGRPTIIAFDADAEQKPEVEAAKTQLRRELQSRGAEVAFLTWDGGRGKGIDDFLYAAGPDTVIELIEKADFDRSPDESISTHELAEAITARHHFAQDAGGRLYVYRAGYYQADGAAFVRQQVKRLMARMKVSAKWTSHKADEVVKYINVDAPLVWGEPPRDRINLVNGILDVTTRELEPHSPEFLSPIQIPVRYDPQAECPFWCSFISGVFPEDSQNIAWEIPAWLMTPDTSIQKAILLIGEGANGKSTYLSAVVAFIGRRNTSALSLHRLEQDKFAAARLVGKLANVCPDLPSDDLASTSTFKAITGGDGMEAERKFQESFEFVPFARLVFSANHPPKSQDGSSGFFRRWLVVPFEQTFHADAEDTIPRDQLDAALADPGELSGLLNKALDALAVLRSSGGFSETDSTRRALTEFRETTDPLAVWLDANTDPEPDGLVPCDALLKGFNQDAVARGHRPMTKNQFGRAIAQLRPTVQRVQRTVSSRLCGCYVGISMRGTPENGAVERLK
jgi:putative DNA primase/helicase